MIESYIITKLEAIAEKTNIPYNTIKEEFNKQKEELKGLISSDGVILLLQKRHGIKLDTKVIKKKEDDVMSIWDNIDLSTNEFNPFLKVKNGILYHLELVDSTTKPRPSVDGYGNDQYIWDVIIRDLEPASAFEDVDKEGKPLFIKNREYSFGIKKTAMRRFKDLWGAVGTVEKFSFKRIGQSFQTDYIFKDE